MNGYLYNIIIIILAIILVGVLFFFTNSWWSLVGLIILFLSKDPETANDKETEDV